uniref:Nuclear RNA export factor 3 n=1 Tax=Nothobranchius furzeri TaxID=105023 RepID=A0A8C6L206_NOTFU
YWGEKNVNSENFIFSNPYVRPRGGPGRFDRSKRQGKSGGGGGGGGGGGNRARGGLRAQSNWYKVTIPHGRKYDKKWLVPALQNICSVPYTPIHVSPKGCFLTGLLSGLCDIRKIHIGIIFLTLSYILIYLSHNFVYLVSQNIDVILNRRTIMEAVIKIIEENIPELACLNLSNNRIHKLDDLTDLVTKVPNLKSLNLSNNELKTDRDLEKIKGLKLVELWLNRNPLCELFKDQAAYIRSISLVFENVSVKSFCRFHTKQINIFSCSCVVSPQDGHDLPPPIGFDVETRTAIPPCKVDLLLLYSYFGSDEIKGLVLQFLQQYYSIYDSGDRQPLLNAYHDGASFVCVSSLVFRNSLGEYHKDSRNLKRVKDSTMRFRLLKHTRLNVVAFLNEFPKTQHDIASFTVDVNTYTNMLLSFTVSGVFKEVVVDGKSRESTMAFFRVLITVPAGTSGLCIVNDQLFVRMATTEEIRRAFVAPAPTPSSSPVPTLTAPQQEMLTSFSQKSGMNLEWSQKCLLDNEWDFNRAAQIFTQLKADGKIPDVAFIK